VPFYLQKLYLQWQNQVILPGTTTGGVLHTMMHLHAIKLSEEMKRAWCIKKATASCSCVV